MVVVVMVMLALVAIMLVRAVVWSSCVDGDKRIVGSDWEVRRWLFN